MRNITSIFAFINIQTELQFANGNIRGEKEMTKKQSNFRFLLKNNEFDEIKSFDFLGTHIASKTLFYDLFAYSQKII